MFQSLNRVSFGPIRARRLALSVWIPAVYWYAEDLSNVVLLVGMACFLRSLMTGLLYREGQLVACNFFRRVAVDSENVVSIRFESRGLSAIRRLVIETNTGKKIAATGVSVWQFPFLLPWQRPEKRLRQLEDFLARSNVADAYRAP